MVVSGYVNKSGLLSESVEYDKMGNITSLKRGIPSSTPTTYTYENNGYSNRLVSTSGAKVGTFTYDLNGNAISDSRRGVTAIGYNLLNLPSTVTATVSGTPTQAAAYTYDAGGTKLKSVQGTITREYISGIQYTDGVLDFAATEEGRVVRNPSTGAYRYEYNMKDNLGNVRVSFDDNAGTARVIQEDEFYAFGLDTTIFTSGTKNNYLYNGKELQQVVLTNEYDYGARFYDPVIGRWNVMDPKAELMRRHSPYNYAFNNPIRFIDPDGMAPEAWKPIYNKSGKASGFEWVPENQSYNADGNLKSGLYHQGIFFSDNGTYDASNSYNMGSSTATVFLADGTTKTYEANTMPSSHSYPAVPKGFYEATVGKHQGKYTALRMHDTGNRQDRIELGFENPAFSDGRTFAGGVNIHKAGINNKTGMTTLGKPISAACMLIDINNWSSFIGNFNNKEQKSNPVGVALSRTYDSPQKKEVPSTNFKFSTWGNPYKLF